MAELRRLHQARVAIFGPTGLAGTGVLQVWLGDPRVSEVRAVTRRSLPASHPRLEEVRCRDFLNLDPIAESLAGLDAVCFCLGISASQARSRAEYRRITHDFALEAGRATLAASPGAVFHFISGSGTSTRSLMNWARVKAETERDLSRLGLGGCVHWRPAMILAKAKPDRLSPLQQFGGFVTRPLRVLPNLAVDNTAIGEAMLQATLESRLDGVIQNREIRALADRYRATRGEER
jgi:uncharacterized protein YbjT (DUF2867 family)